MKKFAIALMLGIAVCGAAVAADLTAAATAEGEVRRLDKEAGKVTVRHGPIQAWDMPGMTMVFRVKDPAMLDRLKVGDRIRMTVTNPGGGMVIESFDASP